MPAEARENANQIFLIIGNAPVQVVGPEAVGPVDDILVVL